MKLLNPTGHSALSAERGSAVMVILIMLSIMVTFAIANSRTTYHLQRELQLIEKRQLLSGAPTVIVSDLERKKLNELLPLLIAEGQRRGICGKATIENAIRNDPETDVKKKAVFALTQMPNDEGIPLLIEVARTNRNPEVRKKAVFWLGQSKDPRALKFFVFHQ
jgi:hypothetical protein